MVYDLIFCVVSTRKQIIVLQPSFNDVKSVNISYLQCLWNTNDPQLELDIILKLECLIILHFGS